MEKGRGWRGGERMEKGFAKDADFFVTVFKKFTSREYGREGNQCVCVCLYVGVFVWMP